MLMPELRLALRRLAPLLLALPVLGASAQPSPLASLDDPVVAAREALRKKDKAQLATFRQQLLASGHPLAQWVDYWELSNRLPDAQQADLNAFYTRWAGTYVEDRLRNDWLLELGKRRDWANFSAEFPRFRMNDDREVTCYALLTQHLAGQDVRSTALPAWFGQRDLDDGCALLAQTLADAGALQADDAWHKVRLAMEANRPRAARAAAALLNPAYDKTLAELADKPERWLARQPGTRQGAADRQLQLLALMRLAANDPDYAAAQLQDGWAQRLGPALAATAWAHVGKQAALKQGSQAAVYARQAWQAWDTAQPAGATPAAPPWSDDLLAWQVRAALRQPAGEPQRWRLVQRAIDAMSASEQRDATWIYWRARATIALAKPGVEGDAARAAGQAALQGIAGQFSFYGKLATEELGGRTVLPAAPQPLSTAERQAPRRLPGFVRALQLIDLGLRHEGVREWNFTLRGMSERELLGAAQWACEREVWDRCINTSDRTKLEIDMAQRFPLPFRDQIVARAQALGLEPALLFGLIRQESRFISDARSGVGAQGLMQLMPATAKWTARKVGLEYRPQMITDRDTNLHLGAAYLKRLLVDFDGSLAMAAAAYNAGPGRPRRWREGALMEPAAWAESIPFTETRDYVKKVLSNSVYYAAMLGQAVPTLKSRLGAPVGPRDPAAAVPDRDLP
jgi:soluble lytic murein transglycosylase